jgi:hypothetical protein
LVVAVVLVVIERLLERLVEEPLPKQRLIYPSTLLTPLLLALVELAISQMA